jgi:nucleoside-diphosphate-sugar epimerase
MVRAVRVLLLGGAGFLGAHINIELSENGHSVTSLDRDSGDLRKPGEAAFWIHNARPDVVVHLAAKVGRQFGEDDLLETIADNAGMTSLVARACGEAKVPLVYASTSEVYGDNGETVCSESAGPFALPHNLYGLSKRWGRWRWRRGSSPSCCSS